ncbi:MAG: hypothetical protein AAGJ81_16240 [Verrucomicrobiota bacterium]
MSAATQHEFPFASLDFPGVSVLRPQQIGGENSPIGVSEEHVYRLIESGDLTAIDISRRNGIAETDSLGRAKRQFLRVPKEVWHSWCMSRQTAPFKPLHNQLTTDQLRQHTQDCLRELQRRGVRI